MPVPAEIGNLAAADDFFGSSVAISGDTRAGRDRGRSEALTSVRFWGAATTLAFVVTCPPRI